MFYRLKEKKTKREKWKNSRLTDCPGAPPVKLNVGVALAEKLKGFTLLLSFGAPNANGFKNL